MRQLCYLLFHDFLILEKSNNGNFSTSAYQMPRASHIFRSICYAKCVELTVDEHSGNYSGWREKKNVYLLRQEYE